MLSSGYIVVGHYDGTPIVYGVDETGAINVEHDIGPHAQEAVTKLESGLKALEGTVKNLQRPAQRTAMVVAGTIATGLVVAAVIFLWGRGKPKRRSTRKQRRR